MFRLKQQQQLASQMCQRIVARRTFFGLPAEGVRGKAFVEFEQGKVEHAAKTAVLWRNIFLFTGIPLLTAVAVNSFMIEREHFAHLEHHPNHYKDLPHLHLRVKPFPWRDGYKSLFYKADAQPLPPADE